MWILPRISKKPLFEQIIDLVQHAIARKQLLAGEKLPSERQLSLLLNVNRSTVTRALNALHDNNVIIRKIGSGSFINPQKWDSHFNLTNNWHSIKYSFKNDGNIDYQRHSEHRLKQAVKENKIITNLATGDVANPLLPKINLTDIPWHDLLSLEQDQETSFLGLYSFRKTIQAHMKTIGVSVNSSQILVTTGTQQALFLLTQSLLKPGDRIGVELPSSFYRLPIFQAFNLKICPLPMDNQGLDIEKLNILLQNRPLKMIFINPIFQNPTGTCLKQSRRQKLLKLCSAYQVPIIEDDSCGLLSFSPTLDTSPIKAIDQRQQVIYVGSLSKYIGSNIRAGWIIAPPYLVNQLAKTRQYVDGGLSILPQMLGEYYMNHQMNDHRNSLIQALQKKLGDFTQWLETYYPNILNYQLPEGGLYLYAKFNSQDLKFIHQFCYQWIKNFIFIAKGEEFGGSSNEIRINFSKFNLY